MKVFTEQAAKEKPNPKWYTVALTDLLQQRSILVKLAMM
jgi:hypothetical protein